MPGLPKALKKSTARSTRRRWTKQLFDGISRAMPHLRAELLLSNNLSNRITWLFEELSYDFNQVLPYIGRRLLRFNGENGLAIRDESGALMILKVNHCSSVVMQGLMNRGETASRDPVLLVYGNGKRMSTQSKNEVLQWFPGRLEDFEKARLFSCLEHLKSWYSEESLVSYGEFGEPILRELTPHSERKDSDSRGMTPSAPVGQQDASFSENEGQKGRALVTCGPISDEPQEELSDSSDVNHWRYYCDEQAKKES